MYVCVYIYIYTHTHTRFIYLYEPEERTGYSNSLQAGRSGDESRWGARFSAPVQNGSEDHPAPFTLGTGVFTGGKAAGSWR